MKIYLAGKITGDTTYREKFARAEAELLNEQPGASVLNPAALPEGMTPRDYMSLCLPMLLQADLVVFLPDWPRSSGAGIERQICVYCDIEVRDWKTADD